MEVGLLEILFGLVIIMMGWLHVRQAALSKKLEEKVDKTDFAEVKQDIKDVLSHITDIKVDNARWQGLMEKVVNNKQGKS